MDIELHEFLKILRECDAALTAVITQVFSGRTFNWGSDTGRLLSALDKLYCQFGGQLQPANLFIELLRQLLAGMENSDVYYFTDRLWMLRQLIRQLIGGQNCSVQWIDNCFNLPTDGEKQFGSLVASAEEARIWADGYYDAAADIFILVGTGRLHYHRELVKRLRPEQQLFILEWEEKNSELFLQEYPQIIELPNVTVRLSKNLDALMREIVRLIDLYVSCRISFTILPPYRQIGKEDVKLIESKISQFLRTNLVVARTTELFALTWPANYYRNIKPMIEKGVPFSEFTGKFAGMPAVIVSAGPSLDKNVDLLPEILDRAVVIASGSAIETLYKVHSIRPHFLASFDGGPGNYPHFKNLKTDDLRLIFSGDIYPPIVEEFAGVMIPTEMANKQTYNLYKKFGAPPLGEALCGPSVANFALDLAVRLGCNPIILIGQDLSVSGGRTHAAGNFYRQDNIDMSGYFKVKGNVEEYVYTNPSWATMLKAFEVQLKLYAKEGKQIINATEGGAYIEGTEVMTLQEAIDLFMKENHRIDGRIQEIINEYKREDIDVEAILAAMLDSARKLRRNITKSIEEVNGLLAGLNAPAYFSKRQKQIIKYLKKQEQYLLEHPVYQYIIRSIISYQILYYERHYRRLAVEQPECVERWVAEYQKVLFETSLKALDAYLVEVEAVD